MRWVVPIPVLAAAMILAMACGDESHHRATTTDETFTSSVGDEDAEDEEEAEPAPEAPGSGEQ